MPSRNTTKASSSRLTNQPTLGKHLIAAIGISVIAGGILAWLYRNQINPDGISYIQVAKHYLDGNLAEAINGYWSPLLSWLLVPFLWLGIDPLFSYRALVFLLVNCTILGLAFIISTFRKNTSRTSQAVQFSLLVSFGITLNIWAVSAITPDVISGIILSGIAYSLYRYLSSNQLKWGLALGIMLSLLYLSKAVGFYVGIIVLAVLLFLQLRTHKRLGKGIIAVTGAFIIPTLIWVGVISAKYQTITISTASTYNFRLIGPASPGHPQLTIGYLPIHSADDVWAWDDPSYLTLPNWSITSSLPYYAKHVATEASRAVNLFFNLSPMLIVLSILVLARKYNKNPATLTVYIFSLIAIVVISLYSLILVEARYLWMIAIPLIALGIANARITAATKPALIVASFFAILISGSSLVSAYLDGSSIATQQGSVKYAARLAGDELAQSTAIAGPYGVYEFCYFADQHCVGTYELTGLAANDQSLIQDMRRHGISYYVTLKKTDNISLPQVSETCSQGRPPVCIDIYKVSD